MQKLIRGTHGQSTAEYAIVIALVLGALVGMQTYLRRSLNARIANATDTRLPGAGMDATLVGQNAGSNANFPAMFDKFAGGSGGGTPSRTQFEPYYAASNSKTISTAESVYDVDGVAGGPPSAVVGSGTSTTKREGGSSETKFLN